MNDDKRKEVDELEELMKEATEGSSNEDNFVDPKKKRNKKIVILALLGVTVFIGLLIAGALMLKGDDFVDKTEDPDWLKQDIENQDLTQTFDFTTDVPKWAEHPYYPKEFWTEKNEEAVLETAEEYYTFFQATAWLPSSVGGMYEGEDPGFTNDISKRRLDNGDENPFFSYALAEDYRKAYTVYTQRLINPIFGDWDIWERYTDNRTHTAFEHLKDMFSPEWWEKNAVKADSDKNIPVFIEREEGAFDKYNLKDLNGEDEVRRSANFFGRVVESEENKVEITGTDAMGMPIIETVTPIEYTALGEDGVVTVKAKLKLKFNSSSSRTNVINRIEISDANLIIE